MNQQVATTNPIHGAMFGPSNYIGTRGLKKRISKFSDMIKNPMYKKMLEDEKKKKKKEGSRYQEPMKLWGYLPILTIRPKHNGPINY